MLAFVSSSVHFLKKSIKSYIPYIRRLLRKMS